MADQLTKLADLRNRAMIPEGEFERQTAKILARGARWPMTELAAMSRTAMSEDSYPVRWESQRPSGACGEDARRRTGHVLAVLAPRCCSLGRARERASGWAPAGVTIK